MKAEKSRQVNVLSNQEGDGGFSYYVTFGDKAPWLADGSEVVKMASEDDAHKLKNIIESNF